MATSRSFGQFSRRMGFLGKTVVKNAEKAVRRAAIAADTAAVLTTPVDTGRARGNWMVAIGSPNLNTIEVGAGGGASALSDGSRVIGSWKIRMGPIFISNSLPYILFLDGGGSAQAPSGMSRHAIQAAETELKKARLLRT